MYFHLLCLISTTITGSHVFIVIPNLARDNLFGSDWFLLCPNYHLLTNGWFLVILTKNSNQRTICLKKFPFMVFLHLSTASMFVNYVRSLPKVNTKHGPKIERELRLFGRDWIGGFQILNGLIHIVDARFVLGHSGLSTNMITVIWACVWFDKPR